MKNRRAITLVELMVTLVIAAGLLSLGLMTMRGYLPRQRLLSSMEALQGILQRAQTEAASRAAWSCIRLVDVDGILNLQLYSDENGNHGAANACGDTGAGDLLLSTAQFRENVGLATGSNCPPNNLTSSCIIWVSPSGLPQICANSGCGASAPGTGCAEHDYQIVVSNSKMDSSARAREVEFTTGGLVKAAKPGTVGLLSTLWASIPPVAAGGCE